MPSRTRVVIALTFLLFFLTTYLYSSPVDSTARRGMAAVQQKVDALRVAQAGKWPSVTPAEATEITPTEKLSSIMDSNSMADSALDEPGNATEQIGKEIEEKVEEKVEGKVEGKMLPDSEAHTTTETNAGHRPAAPTPSAQADSNPKQIDSEENASNKQGDIIAVAYAATVDAELLKGLSTEEREKLLKDREEKEKKAKEEAEKKRKEKLIKEHEKKRDETLRKLAKDENLRAKFHVTPEDIGFVMRTGSEVEKRLRGPLSTWAINRTTENLVLYSDLESKIDAWRIQDAIKPWVDRSAITDTDAAKYWRKLTGTAPPEEEKKKKEEEEERQKIEDKKKEEEKKQEAEEKKKEENESTDKGVREKREFGGWQLDALKFVSSAQLGYHQLRQNRDFKWYVFADDDTYYHLPTMAKLLSNLDYEDEFYVGGVSYFGIAFAHGGAGAVASAGAMKKRFIDNEDGVGKFHDKGATAQYGDTNLAQAFADVDIWYDHSFREAFNGEQPYQRPLWKDTLCQSVVTFHHFSIDFMTTFHARVKDFAELTYMHVLSKVVDQDRPLTDLWSKQDWTFNMDPRDTGKADEAKDMRNNHMTYTVDERHKDQLNPERCKSMCAENERCIAWTYIKDEHACYLSDWFRSGHERKGSTSGVDANRLSQWMNNCKPWWPKKFD